MAKPLKKQKQKEKEEKEEMLGEVKVSRRKKTIYAGKRKEDRTR